MEQNSLFLIIKTTRLLFIASMALGLYLIYNAVMAKEPEIVIDFKPANTAAALQSGDIEPAREADFGAYVDVFKKRDFFESPLEQQQREKQGVYTVSQTTELDLSTQYKLVGIVLDVHPQAVVEDLTKKETLFLSVGDKLGDAVLEEIKPGEVILLYRGQKLELLQ